MPESGQSGSGSQPRVWKDVSQKRRGLPRSSQSPGTRQRRSQFNWYSSLSCSSLGTAVYSVDHVLAISISR